MGHKSVIPILGRWRLKEQKSEIIFSYIVSVGPLFTTRSLAKNLNDLIKSKKRKKNPALSFINPVLAVTSQPPGLLEHSYDTLP